MKVHKIDHVGIVVNDLAAAKAFFLAFGLELQGEGIVEGEWVDNVVGLHDVKDAYAMLRTPNGEATIDSSSFTGRAAKKTENGLWQILRVSAISHLWLKILKPLLRR